MRKNIGNFVLGAALATTGLYGIAVSDLVAFKAGDPIKSVEVNQNFSILKSALEAPIATGRLADGAVTLPKLSVAGSASDGKVLKLQEGKLSWADDQMGSGTGGASYAAGSGLNLSGTTFSLADRGVTAEKLSAQNSPKASQFLAFNGSDLVWADGTSGTAGPQGPKGDKGEAGPPGPAGQAGPAGPQGPVGPSGTASLEDGSITTAKLANGGVTASKLGTQNPAAANKFLAFNGSNMVWADGTSGTAGPQGPKGEKGDTGPAGAPGAKGDAGAPGPKGDKGDTGPQGPVGPQGPSGTTADGSVTTNKLANNAVNTAKLADASVTRAKLAEKSVLDSHIAMPLSFSSGSSVALLSLKNVEGIGLAAQSVGSGFGIYAEAGSAPGIFAKSQSSFGVDARSSNGVGVRGIGDSGGGVFGESKTGSGVIGRSSIGPGVQGLTGLGVALMGHNNSTLETLQLIQYGNGALIDARGATGATVFSVDRFGNVFSSTNSYKSDRNAKTNFEGVDTKTVLEKVAALPITRWNYKHDTKAVQHIGPMAQDFKAAFGLDGSDNTRINSVDVQGVALAAIQGLYQKNQGLEQEVSRLKAMEEHLGKLKKLESQNQALQTRLTQIEQQLASLKHN